MKTPEQMEFDFDAPPELNGLDEEEFTEAAYELALKQEQLNTEGETE